MWIPGGACRGDGGAGRGDDGAGRGGGGRRSDANQRKEFGQTKKVADRDLCDYDGDEIPPLTDQLAAVSLDNDVASSWTVPNQVRIRSILDHPDGGAGLVGKKVRISGSVRLGSELGL